MRQPRRLFEWLHARSGYRDGLSHLLDEKLPPGTGWWFTLGSALLFLLAVQAVTGVLLTLYYAPTPDHAWESVRFISREVRLGWLVRGLHYFGASFLVVFAAMHLLRVVLFGSYKPPRELTWLTGVALLLLLLAFALTGYLLPWDQRAYWATVVTINLMALPPVVGDAVAALARGGPEIGALTLSRWYSAHVVLLPAALAALVILHLFLMRRHGISGPVKKASAPDAFSFYPYQAARDVTVAGGIAVALVALAWGGMPALEAPADPTDATYTPRPEWYFLGLFQLLKYFPGRLELVGAIVIPGLLLLALALLPWIDRRPDRDPRRRIPLVAGVAVAVIAIVILTAAGWRDRPLHSDAWTARPIAGSVWVAHAGCDRCHGGAGIADTVGATPLTRPPAWLASHIADPEVIAPGLREAPKVDQREVDAIVAYVRRASRGETAPRVPDAERDVALIFARHCVGCHRLDGDGGSQSDDDGPDLTHAGAKRDAAWLRRWIADPEAMDPDAEMPGFDKKLTAVELDLISSYLAARK